MTATAIAGIILSALSAIQAILPLLSGNLGTNPAVVTNIINMLAKIVPMLEQIAPLVGNEISLLYQGVKNIIANLKGESIATTAQQDADLDALDAMVDSGWDAIAPQFDPDYVPPGAAPAG